MNGRSVTFQQLIDQKLLVIGDGYRAKNDELGGTGPIFLRAGHVTDTHIDLTGVDRFHANLAAVVANKMSQRDDVVVTTKGNSTGRVTFIAADIPSVVYSPHLSFWRSLDQEQLAPGFLRYWSRSSEFHDQLSGLKASTDMAPYLSLVDQRRLRVTLPAPSAQKEIARILGALDDKIELNRRTNDTLEAMARATFKSWFVDFEPVRAKLHGHRPANMSDEAATLFPNEFEDSDYGKVPRGWKVFRLKDCGQWLSGGTPSKANAAFWNGSIPWFSAKSMHEQFLDDTEDRVTDAAVAAGTRLACEGSVLFLVRGMSLATEFRFGIAAREVAFNQDVKAIVPAADIDGVLIAGLLAHETERILAMTDEASHGTKRLRTERIEEIRIALPPAPNRLRLAEPLKALAKLRLSNYRNSITLTEARTALLPKLLSGELRIPAAETAASNIL